ncbi:MAG: RNA 2',3'-cyclic phosphodiesterase [bacterium]
MSRVFFALPVSGNARKAVADIAARASRDFDEIRWVPAANYHLTLKFLGEVPSAELDAVREAVGLIPAGFPALPISFDCLDFFGPPRLPRVLFVRGERGGEAEKTYARLALSLEEAVRGWCKPEERPFRAHLTLGRFRMPRPGERISAANEKAIRALASGKLEYAKFSPIESRADRIVLYESSFTREGVSYSEIAFWPLAGG